MLLKRETITSNAISRRTFSWPALANLCRVLGSSSNNCSLSPQCIFVADRKNQSIHTVFYEVGISHRLTPHWQPAAMYSITALDSPSLSEQLQPMSTNER